MLASFPASVRRVVATVLAGFALVITAVPIRAMPPAAYRVARLTDPLRIDANWDKPAWQRVPAGELRCFMGERPAHFPRTRFKMQYDDEALYVIFRVEDRWVRAVAQRHQDPVCTDSCVEFFFSPHHDPALGYYNLETNCGGVMLFHFQRSRHVGRVVVDARDLERIDVAHSLPRRVEPEIAEPTTWTVEYRLPFDAFARYCPEPFAPPTSGDVWKGNCYKIADDTSHPHWLTWAPVAWPEPDFHRPEFFGRLEFE